MYKPPSLDGLHTTSKQPGQKPAPNVRSQGTPVSTNSPYKRTSDSYGTPLKRTKKQDKAKSPVGKMASLAKSLLAALFSYARQVITRPGKHKLALVLAVSVTTTLVALALLPKALNPGQIITDNQVLNSNLPTTPTFATLAPNGDIKQTSGGEMRYDASKKVASYTDTVKNASVTVSQQELPGHFLIDPAASMTNLATSLNAKDGFTSDGVTVYMGQPNNTPTAVFIKNQVLVFIAIQGKLSNQALSEYISKLR